MLPTPKLHGPVSFCRKEIIDHKQLIRGYVQGSTKQILSEKFLNTTIQFSGTCGSQFDSNQDLIGSQLFSPSVNHVKILPHQLPPGDAPSVIPPMKALAQYDQAPETLPRLGRFQGMVTIVNEDGNFYFEDETAGILVIGNEGSDF